MTVGVRAPGGHRALPVLGSALTPLALRDAAVPGVPHDPRREAVSALGQHFMQASKPRTPHVHLLAGENGEGHLFLPDGSRLFDADAPLLYVMQQTIEQSIGAPVDANAVPALLERLGVTAAPYVNDEPVASPPLHALSLAVAQKCNLGCTYCYAQQGEFGGPATQMSAEQALRAVDLMIDAAEPGARLNLAFMGGEPLVNRPVLRLATEHAVRRAETRGVHVNFSITTNGTLVTPDDGEFFETHGFAVTISLDGPREVHDAQRPTRSGRGSFDRIMRNIAPLLTTQRRMQVTARVTVTPENLGLRETLDTFVDLGFHSVGFAPMLSSPNGHGEMQSADLQVMLGEMIDCGREYERRILRGGRYPFSNVVNAMREIHRGTHRPYPCGAGAGYLGVSADGELSACHRFVGDEAGRMGSIDGGIDRTLQNRWLADRHVHTQSPCTSCWARYLCGGGCHHEVIARGRPACDYVRGWLHYCLGAYLRLSPHLDQVMASTPVQLS